MAWPGTLVYCEGGREAALASASSFVPVRSVIVGIIDAVTVEQP